MAISRAEIEDALGPMIDILMAIRAERDAERAAREVAEARVKELESALDRTEAYIRTAMRPISVKEACGEGLYERAHRSGLQHALNAIAAEFSKVPMEAQTP